MAMGGPGPRTDRLGTSPARCTRTAHIGSWQPARVRLTGPRAFASKFGVDRSYGSYDAAVADGAVDAVYVAAPNHLHAELALPRLLSGDPEQQLLAELQLDYTRDQLRATAGLDREQARAALEAGWRAELDPLAQDPETARELQALVEQLRQELRNGMVDAGKKARTRKHWRAALRPIPGVLDWYRVNAFAGILLAAGFVVLKCYVVARGDITTALGILQYVGPATVVTASLLSSLSILAAAMLAAAVSQLTWSLVPKVVTAERIKPPDPPAFTWHLAAALLGAFVLAAGFSPWTYLPAAAVIGLVIGVARAVGTPTRRTVVYWLAALVALPFATVNLYAVWLPHEIVTFTPGTLPRGATQELGYVLSEDNGWITMLVTDHVQKHTIIRVPDAKVTTQVVCEREPNSGIFEAHTLWRVVTRASPTLRPSPNTTCP